MLYFCFIFAEISKSILSLSNDISLARTNARPPASYKESQKECGCRSIRILFLKI